MYIIGLNGPPRSGKDTIAAAIGDRLDLSVTPFIKASLAQPIRNAVFAMLGMQYTTEVYESTKDDKQDATGHSIREMMIRLSEEHAIPLYGQSFWGDSLVRSLPPADLPAVVVIPDIGFDRELLPLANYVGRDNFMVMKIARDGVEWRNDSRRYITSPHYHGCFVDNPEGNVELAAQNIIDYASVVLGWTI